MNNKGTCLFGRPRVKPSAMRPVISGASRAREKPTGSAVKYTEPPRGRRRQPAADGTHEVGIDRQQAAERAGT